MDSSFLWCSKSNKDRKKNDSKTQRTTKREEEDGIDLDELQAHPQHRVVGRGVGDVALGAEDARQLGEVAHEEEAVRGAAGALGDERAQLGQVDGLAGERVAVEGADPTVEEARAGRGEVEEGRVGREGRV